MFLPYVRRQCLPFTAKITGQLSFASEWHLFGQESKDGRPTLKIWLANRISFSEKSVLWFLLTAVFGTAVQSVAITQKREAHSGE